MMDFFKENPNYQRGRVIDCGAGIGRISKELLCQVFKTVDVIDQCEKYIDKAKDILKDKKIGHFYAKGLQEFEFEEKYDCIWIQWVFSQLTDEDGIAFLKKCKVALNEGGIIVMKENHNTSGFLVDKADFSVTRSYLLFKELFEKAGLEIVKNELQLNWPA